MDTSEELNVDWFDGLEDELVRELLDDESPLFFVPKDVELPHQAGTLVQAIANPFTSNVYSGPTIEDIESALSSTYRSNTVDAGEQQTTTSRSPYVHYIRSAFIFIN